MQTSQGWGYAMARLIAVLLVALGALATPVYAQKAAPGCRAPQAVCAASARVFVISSYDPVGSAVLIDKGLLVTARHVIADNPAAQVLGLEGGPRTAQVIPTAYPGDLVLLKIDGLDPGAPAAIRPAAVDQQVYVIGADVGRSAVRAYLPGRVIAVPPADKPMARVHHSARSQPGNSGGALVSREGDLVAIVASGGEGRNEAVPATEIEKLKSMSGPDRLAENARIGMAYRKCTEALDAARTGRARLTDAQVTALVSQCLATRNRQMYDDAGRILGQQGYLDQALDLFKKSLADDPNGLNTRLSLAITLHVAQRYGEELPHLKKLIEALPSDPQVLRLGIQAGKWGGDEAFAEKAFQLLATNHPQLKGVAEKFMKQPPPAPHAVAPR